MKLQSGTNHAINGFLIAAALAALYNRLKTGQLLVAEDLMPLVVMMIGQYLNSFQALKAESPEWITAKQAITILEMAEGREVDANALSKQKFNVELGALYRKQATSLILDLKKISKPELLAAGRSHCISTGAPLPSTVSMRSSCATTTWWHMR